MLEEEVLLMNSAEIGKKIDTLCLEYHLYSRIYLSSESTSNKINPFDIETGPVKLSEMLETFFSKVRVFEIPEIYI